MAQTHLMATQDAAAATTRTTAITDQIWEPENPAGWVMAAKAPVAASTATTGIMVASSASAIKIPISNTPGTRRRPLLSSSAIDAARPVDSAYWRRNTALANIMLAAVTSRANTTQPAPRAGCAAAAGSAAAVAAGRCNTS